MFKKILPVFCLAVIYISGADNAHALLRYDSIVVNGCLVGYMRYEKISPSYKKIAFYTPEKVALGHLHTTTAEGARFLCLGEKEPWIAAAVLKAWNPQLEVVIKRAQ